MSHLVSAGGRSSCCRTDLHTAWCWGANDRGQLGDGTMINRITPVQVSGLINVVYISAGQSSHTCAVKTDGTAWCWGHNSDGQHGDGSTADSLVAVAVTDPY